jgi:hypothetical protein
MMDIVTQLVMIVGAAAFGVVIGWTTYFIMRRAQPKALTDLTTILGILGGATILGLFDPKGPMFGGYAIGLLIGFFAYYIQYRRIVGVTAMREALLKEPGTAGLTLD